ncbi:hypothetical protein [Microbulbifer sp. S227A]|uniref:hypothetical protein n=1 Tax=Microbulbifer sp. S227A TaxID=3415131 RepID=UPI003C7D30CC
MDHVHGVTLQLKASANVGTSLATLRELEQARESGQGALIKLLQDKTERSPSAIGADLSENADLSDISGLLSSCRGDAELRDRILPFVRLLETDPWGLPSRSLSACSLSSAGSLISSLPVPRQAISAGEKFGQRQAPLGTSRQCW